MSPSYSSCRSPIDEKHATYAEDPYSLSKWECEQQCDSFVRRYESMRIASFRMHEVRLPLALPSLSHIP